MKKKILSLILVVMILLTSGCTKYLMDDNNKRVTYNKTGQTLTSNILCKPTGAELTALYQKNNKSLLVPIEKLPACKNFKPTDIGYSSLWETIFVKPLAYAILQVGNFVHNYGVAVMVIGLLIRFALFPVSKKTITQSENMKKAKPELDNIEKKYKDKKDNESMMAKSQEMMLIYKKYNINPVSSCIVAFIQLPLFFAFLEAINRVPAIFEENLLGLQLGTTPLKGIGGGNYLYILLIALIIGTTYLTFKNSMTMSTSNNKDAQGQMQLMSKLMLIFISIASLSLPAAIGIYWIVTNAFAVVQNILIKRKKELR